MENIGVVTGKEQESGVKRAQGRIIFLRINAVQDFP